MTNSKKSRMGQNFLQLRAARSNLVTSAQSCVPNYSDFYIFMIAYVFSND
jgi:hypothetical protein